jgi:alanine dehydrogenase
VLIINNEIVAEVLTMADCIGAQEEAFKKIPTGGAIHRPRIDMYMPAEREDGYFRWGTMEGANDGFFAIRMKSDIMYWPENESGNWTEEKYCREPGTYCGIVLLINTNNAEPLAFINDGHIQHMRVGGGAGIGVKHLSREDSHTVGMLGSGGMARTFLEAFCCVRDIRKCKIYSPTKEQAVAGVDILSTCTDSMVPVYDPAWIEPGMHVTNLGRREISDGVMDKFDVVIRQGTAGLQMKQTERFQAERGLSPAAFIGGSTEQMKRIPEKNPNPGFGGDDPEFNDRGKGGDKPDFAAMIADPSLGRTNPEQVTFYRNVGNQGLQFSSVGAVVYKICKERGLGMEIPTDWFLQDIRD